MSTSSKKEKLEKILSEMERDVLKVLKSVEKEVEIEEVIRDAEESEGKGEEESEREEESEGEEESEKEKVKTEIIFSEELHKSGAKVGKVPSVNKNWEILFIGDTALAMKNKDTMRKFLVSESKALQEGGVKIYHVEVLKKPINYLLAIDQIRKIIAKDIEENRIEDDTDEESEEVTDIEEKMKDLNLDGDESEDESEETVDKKQEDSSDSEESEKKEDSSDSSSDSEESEKKEDSSDSSSDSEESEKKEDSSDSSSDSEESEKKEDSSDSEESEKKEDSSDSDSSSSDSEESEKIDVSIVDYKNYRVTINSGLVNPANIKEVSRVSGLSIEKIKYIVQNLDSLTKKYRIVKVDIKGKVKDTADLSRERVKSVFR